MKYENHNDLPQGVRSSLPRRAQILYRDAYNAAWDSYDELDDAASREEEAHKAAWSSVKKSFVRNIEGKWVERKSTRNTVNSN